MNPIVRPLRQSDRDVWQGLYYEYLAFYESEPVSKSTDLLWTHLVSEPPLIQSTVIEVDGVIAGFAHFHYQLSTWTHTWHCYLEDLFVHEQFRSRGLATALIQEVQRAAIQAKCSEFFWITRAGNTKARAVYDKVATATDFIRYEILFP